jgi:hypothetical protein
VAASEREDEADDAMDDGEEEEEGDGDDDGSASSSSDAASSDGGSPRPAPPPRPWWHRPIGAGGGIGGGGVSGRKRPAVGTPSSDGRGGGVGRGGARVGSLASASPSTLATPSSLPRGGARGLALPPNAAALGSSPLWSGGGRAVGVSPQGASPAGVRGGWGAPALHHHHPLGASPFAPSSVESRPGGATPPHGGGGAANGAAAWPTTATAGAAPAPLPLRTSGGLARAIARCSTGQRGAAEEGEEEGAGMAEP